MLGICLLCCFSHKVHSPRVNAFVAEALALPADNEEYELHNAENGKWYSVANCLVPWGGVSNARMFFCLDITASHQRKRELERAAETDALTGTMNRHGLNRMIATLWDQCEEINKPLSIIMLDIDHFKRVNDTYGHPEGDRCLQAFGATLHDVVARPDDVVARYGGEEFCVLLPYTGREGAMQVAENIRAAVEEMALTLHDGKKDVPVSITTSAGVSSIIPVAGLHPIQFLNVAADARYEAKNSGRNCVRFSEPLAK